MLFTERYGNDLCKYFYNIFIVRKLSTNTVLFLSRYFFLFLFSVYKLFLMSGKCLSIKIILILLGISVTLKVTDTKMINNEFNGLRLRLTELTNEKKQMDYIYTGFPVHIV